jgi:molybdenum cofactor biosynthesis enzyme MoaA
VDLKKPLRAGAEDQELKAAIRQAIQDKPQKHALENAVFRKCINRPMRAIGG